MAELSGSRRPFLISFSGIDGAGKSTQISNLQTRLREAGLSVKLIAFWDDIALLKTFREFSSHAVFRSEKGVGAPDRPVARRDKNVQTWYMTGFRCLLYLLDAVWLRIRVSEFSRVDGATAIIFDRYIYDELANLPLHLKMIRGYVGWMMKFVPRPDVAYLLDADPVQAVARKPEYPLEFVRSNRASYLSLSKLLGDMTVIAPSPLEEATRQVAEAAMKKLSPLTRK